VGFPNIVVKLNGNKRNYVVVFELQFTFLSDSETAVAKIYPFLQDLIDKLEDNILLIKEKMIGVVVYWDPSELTWKVTLLEGIKSSNRTY